MVPAEVVEEVFAPGFRAHGVDGMDDAVSEQIGPEAVHDGARDPTVIGVSHEFCKALEALVAWRCGVDLADFGERPGGGGGFTGAFFASRDFDGFFAVDRGESVCVSEFPAVDEAVVAGSALHVDAEERL